jgi:hypothetical protein
VDIRTLISNHPTRQEQRIYRRYTGASSYPATISGVQFMALTKDMVCSAHASDERGSMSVSRQRVAVAGRHRYWHRL